MSDIVEELRAIANGPHNAAHIRARKAARQAADEIVRLRLELAEAQRALELSRSNAVFYKDGVLIAAFDQYGRQIHAHKVVTL